MNHSIDISFHKSKEGLPEDISDQFLEQVVNDVRTELQDKDLSIAENHRNVAGTLGPEWLPVLTAVLSGPAVLLAVKAIRDVLRAHVTKQNKITIELRKGENHLIVDATNIDTIDPEEIISGLYLN